MSNGSTYKADMEEIRGMVFLGLVLNYLLWGVQITQSYYYYRTYRETDRAWLKRAVALLCVVEALQSICVSENSWVSLVDVAGDSLREQKIGWGGGLVSFMDALTASIVHFLYAQKIWTLLGHPYKYICTAAVLTMSCFQFVGGFGCTVLELSINLTIDQYERVRTWASIWLFTAAITDVTITSIMTWKLSSLKTGYRELDDIISKLIRLIVETGLATAVLQTAHIIIYLVFPISAYHMVAAFVGPKVYSNAMLALLNSRRPFKETEVSATGERKTLDSIQGFTARTVSQAGGGEGFHRTLDGSVSQYTDEVVYQQNMSVINEKGRCRLNQI